MKLGKINFYFLFTTGTKDILKIKTLVIQGPFFMFKVTISAKGALF